MGSLTCTRLRRKNNQLGKIIVSLAKFSSFLAFKTETFFSWTFASGIQSVPLPCPVIYLKVPEPRDIFYFFFLVILVYFLLWVGILWGINAEGTCCQLHMHLNSDPSSTDALDHKEYFRVIFRQNKSFYIMFNMLHSSECHGSLGKLSLVPGMGEPKGNSPVHNFYF